MPLSEDEQRVLRDIERNFYENDPAFAEAVGNAVIFRHAKRNAKLAGIGFVISLALLLSTFTQAPLVGFLGFLGMVACAFVVVQNVRRVGATGLKDTSRLKDTSNSERAQRVNSSVTDLRADLRDKFRRRFGPR